MKQTEVFKKGNLCFTKDGQAVMTSSPAYNLRLDDKFVEAEMPYARRLVVPENIFPKLQEAVDGKIEDLTLNRIVNTYFR